MKRHYKTLVLYEHRKNRDITDLIGIQFVRIIFRCIALFLVFYLLDSSNDFINNYAGGKYSSIVFNLIIDVVIIVMLYIRKPIMLNYIRFTCLGIFIYNILYLLFISYDSNSSNTLIFSGIVAIYCFKSIKLSYYYICSKESTSEFGLYHSFGSKLYHPKYNTAILYHMIESEVFEYITISHSSSRNHQKSKMYQINEVFCAHLAVACATIKTPATIEETLLLREKLMKTYKWHNSVVSANEDSFMRCMYILRKTYSSSKSIDAAIVKLSQSLSMSGVNIDPEELAGGLLHFREKLKSEDIFEEYYNNHFFEYEANYTTRMH